MESSGSQRMVCRHCPAGHMLPLTRTQGRSRATLVAWMGLFLQSWKAQDPLVGMWGDSEHGFNMVGIPEHVGKKD